MVHAAFRSRALGLAVSLSIALASFPAAAIAASSTGDPQPQALAAAKHALLPAWDGSIDLYRDGVFTTQKSWLWCTAAGVQIVRNIVKHRADHSTSSQRAYFDWMRKRNRYDLPLSAGVDPAGWTAGLRHFVDDRYRLVASRTFDEALRSAVERLRRTNLPVAITVSHGNHGWILTGFRATADPAKTSSFKVTSVRVVGPLYGLQSKNGYDMPPNTRLTPTQFRRFFTPWKYAPMRMVWDGRYVSIQPVPRAAAARPAPTPSKPRASASVRPTPTMTATPTAVASPRLLAAIPPGPTPAGTTVEAVEEAVQTTGDVSPLVGLVVALGAFVVLGAVAIGRRTRRRIPPA